MKLAKLPLFIAAIAVMLSGCAATYDALTELYREDEFDNFVNFVLATDERCSLPCLGGLTAGRSSFDDVRSFLDHAEAEGISAFEYLPQSYSLGLLGRNYAVLSSDISVSEGILQEYSVTIFDPNHRINHHSIQLASVFSQLGNPDDVFVLFAGPPLRFTLTIVYNDLGVMFSYSGVYSDPNLANSGDRLPICLSSDTVNLERVEVWLQNPDSEILVEENKAGLRDDREMRPHWDINRLTDTSPEEFAHFFLNHPGECFLTLSVANLRDEGYLL